MTNPNNAVGTNGAFGGRTSVNAFNDVMGGLSRGVLSGWSCAPNSGLTVSLGGNGTTRDVAIAEDNAGNKTSINNISGSPIDVTLGAAPGTNSRIDAIVAYVDNPPSGSDNLTDNPEPCGLIAVQGTTASSPSQPTDAQIRTAITSDGASGTTAYYVVLAYITMASGTTDITSNMIASGTNAMIADNKINFATLGNYFMQAPSGDISITTSAVTTIASFNAPCTGTYFVFGKCNIDATPSSGPYCVSTLKIKNSVVGTTITSPSTDNRVDVTVIGWGQAKAGDVISLTVSVNNMTAIVRQDRTYIGVIRVA